MAATASAAERRITLPLDHGDPGAGTFEGRYFVNATAYDAGAGPIFVLMGGEGPVSEKYFQGLVGVLAAKYAGLAVALEHRFYGDSVPGRDLGTANLRYLTVAQALADAAATIRAVKAEYGSPATQVFTVGGSYSGALSAYMRMAHPDVTDGSLASSGVVNAIFDFYQFDVHIHNVLAPPCREAWRATVRLMDAELAEGRGAALKARFGAQALTDDDFRYMTADAAAMAAQYGHKDVLCRAMQVGEETGDRLVAFAEFVALLWGKDFGGSCFYSTSCLKDDPQKWQPTARAWRWQKCTEMAYLQSSPLAGEPMRSTWLTLDTLLDQCEAVFGVLPDTSGINAKFGGDRPFASNVFYTNFKDDPWVEAGIDRAAFGEDASCFADCDLCGHCQDLHAPQESDPPELAACRERFYSRLEAWMGALPPA